MEPDHKHSNAPPKIRQDLEIIEHWSERNGIEFQLALAWAVNGQLPTVRIGDRCMINSALLRRWLLTQKWTS